MFNLKIEKMKSEILELLKKYPGCQVWVTHLLEERANGDLEVSVGRHNYVVKKGTFVAYEKLEVTSPLSKIENDVTYTAAQRTCLIVFRKAAPATANAWDVAITQKPCPATQPIFSGDDTDLDFTVI
ncbi:hypothetical protein [Leadbetterella sp. DM7]|uniref:hypothetical protein n=1 Tax=Leadbetterella sp. DM7 TaxID=3235085 RepID=UPI00349EF192